MSTCDLKIIRLPVVASTNDYLKELARSGEREPLIVISDEQTGGKGTKHRSFVSKKGGVYLSILIKPHTDGFDATLVTPMTAVAVSDTIEQISGRRTDIKWVNDIYLEGKKVSGILCESVVLSGGEMPYIIVGIGVNLFTPDGGFTDEIKNIAASVFEKSDDKIKEEFITALVENFFKYFNNLSEKTFLSKYRQKNIVLGKNVTVIQGDDKRLAKALSIDEHCRLLVEFDDKTQKLLSSGEVSLKI